MKYSTQDITVLITCFKEGQLLRRAIESLDQQTTQGFKIILVNDCSPDLETNTICDELAERSDITYIRHEENGGLSKSRNTGFSKASTPIVMPLDADDTFPENAIEETLRTFNQHPNTDMVFGGYQVFDSYGKVTQKTTCQEIVGEDNLLNFYAVANNWILMGTSPCTRGLWQRIGGYRQKFANTVQDVDFWRRAAVSGFDGRFTGSVIYNWYRADDGMNASVNEDDYLPLRIDSLPFYDRFNPDYGIEMRNYIYRYYSSRLMAEELNQFVTQEEGHFSKLQILKAKLMYFPTLYKVGRLISNCVKK